MGKGIIGIIDAAFKIITSTLIPMAFALCLLYFFWGVAKYIKEVGQGKEEGKRIMVWGVVGIFVAFSIWGIIAFLQSELNISPIFKIDQP